MHQEKELAHSYRRYTQMKAKQLNLLWYTPLSIFQFVKLLLV